MCRNIRPLFNFEPPATDDEIRNASLQFVRKISGFTKPSHANQETSARRRRGNVGRTRPHRVADDIGCTARPRRARRAHEGTRRSPRRAPMKRASVTIASVARRGLKSGHAG